MYNYEFPGNVLSCAIMLSGSHTTKFENGEFTYVISSVLMYHPKNWRSKRKESSGIYYICCLLEIPSELTCRKFWNFMVFPYRNYKSYKVNPQYDPWYRVFLIINAA